MKQENEYSYDFETVLNEVKNLENGVLFRCIEIMAPGNADEIIGCFSIKYSGSFYDDFQVLNQIPSIQPVLKRVDFMNVRNTSLMGFVKKPINWNPHFSVGLIVIIALVAIGLWTLQQHSNMRLVIPFRKNQSKDNQGTNSSVASQDEKSEANLWLVIPCNRIEPFLQKAMIKKSFLPSDEAVALVRESVYFLVTADNDKPRLPSNEDWEFFPEGSDLFVQLCIPDGGKLAGIYLKGVLARSLSDKQNITIKKIGLLHDLNSLEKFHRA